MAIHCDITAKHKIKSSLKRSRVNRGKEEESSTSMTVTTTTTSSSPPPIMSHLPTKMTSLADTKTLLASKISELKERQLNRRQQQSVRQQRQDDHQQQTQQPEQELTNEKDSVHTKFQSLFQKKTLQSKNNNNNNPFQIIQTHTQNILASLCTTIYPEKMPLLVLVVTLLGTSIGFQSFLYFVTVGYALAIFLVSSMALLVYNNKASHTIPTLTNIHTSLALLWSLRLMIFLLHREYVNWPQLHKRTIQVNERSRMESKFSVWIICSFFYATMVMPCIYRMQDAIIVADENYIPSSSSSSPWGIVGKIGLILQGTGLLLESVADAQKSSFKSRNRGENRSKWCHVGLWKYSTHPNFLGEGMFWVGTYLGGIGCCCCRRRSKSMNRRSIMPWMICTVGLLFITFVIRGAVESLSVKQLRNYGQDGEFLEFKKTHGFFGPFRIPKHLAVLSF
mmetsp:Transcript_24321/g.36050  ORF Transcript_24321/g.36050 Transcript_24321/m.36050 type:complete len:450 (-) Transcript_24321:195-1544(-)